MRLLVREAGDVAHDQDVLGEAGLRDHLKLVAQPFALRLAGVAVAPLEAFLAELPQVAVGGHALGDAGVGQQGAPEVEADVDLLGDARGGGRRPRAARACSARISCSERR